MKEPVCRKRFTCRICKEQGIYDAYTLKEMMHGSRAPFEYIHCSKCGCLQIGDIPADLSPYYPSDYYSQKLHTEPKPHDGIKGLLIRWYCRSAVLRRDALIDRAIRNMLPVPTDFAEIGNYLMESRLGSAKDRILDVGCGASPRTLAAMRRSGFSMVEGIDPFNAKDSWYEDIPVYRRSIDQMEGEYGLVMFHHSLEHVPDPVSTLRSAAQLLRPGGTCLVRIPVMGTYFWHRFGVNWVELDAPRHLHLFSVESMHLLAEQAGFKVRKIVFDSEGWEIAASIRYEQDIPLRSPQSLTDSFSLSDLMSFKQQADKLNTLNDAGRAGFYLERLPTPT